MTKAEPPLSKETEALMEAQRILHRACLETFRGPGPIFHFVQDAEQYVDGLIQEHLFSESK